MPFVTHSLELQKLTETNTTLHILWYWFHQHFISPFSICHSILRGPFSLKRPSSMIKSCLNRSSTSDMLGSKCPQRPITFFQNLLEYRFSSTNGVISFWLSTQLAGSWSRRRVMISSEAIQQMAVRNARSSFETVSVKLSSAASMPSTLLASSKQTSSPSVRLFTVLNCATQPRSPLELG